MKILMVLLGFLAVPVSMLARDESVSQSFNANPCMIEVFHTNFMFPPEGGRIVQTGGRMFFVRDYLPGCENAGRGSTVLTGNFSTPNPTPAPVPNQYSYQTPYQTPKPNCY